MHTFESRTLSLTIRRCPHAVYDFISNPRNLSQWATGLGENIRQGPAGWLAETVHGPVTFHFSPTNDFGVLDHIVTLPDGRTVFVPMRVVINGSGSEVQLVLFRHDGVTDEAFAADADWVVRDLQTLKAVLERQ